MALGRSLLCLGSGLLLTGCSSFHREFREGTSAVLSPNSIEGVWEGSWKSETCGHHGKLRGIVYTSGTNGTIARFRATWARVLTGEYRIPIQVVSQPDRQTFRGTANLGRWVGGQYTYEGYVASNRFFSEYHCASDHGTFQMVRPGTPSPAR